MAEWSKAHAWKVCIRQRIEGSNPSPSAKQAALTEQTAAPNFYKQDKKAVAKTLDELNALETTLEQTYARWNELEARAEENTE